MIAKVTKALLLDDNAATNYIHKRIIEETGCINEVIDFVSAFAALDYLNQADLEFPEILFVDLNMPQMDAWEFIEEFQTIENPAKDQAKIILLTSSLSFHDKKKIRENSRLSEVQIKPLTSERILTLVDSYL